MADAEASSAAGRPLSDAACERGRAHEGAARLMVSDGMLGRSAAQLAGQLSMVIRPASEPAFAMPCHLSSN